MAILKAGVNGPFSGRVGNIVGYELNGQAIIRAIPDRVKREPTLSEKINRGRMKAVSQFLKPLKVFVDFGYKNLSPKGSRVGAFQLAQSHTFRHAIDYDTDGMPYVNPEKVFVFRGNLLPPQEVTVERSGNLCHFRWRAEKNMGQQFIALAYVVEEYADFNEDGIPSATGELQWTLPDYMAKHSNIHFYVGFYDLFGGTFSDSIYAGCY